jgi:aryl-alcohol dehydrogenase-like predicted oxidoreductase
MQRKGCILQDPSKSPGNPGRAAYTSSMPQPWRKVPLGQTGIELAPLGLGCMSMSDFYDTPADRDEAESVATIVEALDRGVQLIDTADIYGIGHNEQLVGRAFQQWRAAGGDRASIILATKFGNVRDDQGNWQGRNGTPEYAQFACERSLKHLGGETIDLYYLHRVDPATPIEETVGGMARLVEQGKVRFIGLSEASVETLRRACAVHPVTALQTEYSLWYREPERAQFAACAELGVTFVPYSPLGRGFLTGAYSKAEDFAAGDSRPTASRFQGENFTHNLQLAQGVKQLAARMGCTPAQLALAWIMAQGNEGPEVARAGDHAGAARSGQRPHILPIPGCKQRVHLRDNLGALQVQLSVADAAELEALAPVGWAAGERYAPQGLAAVNI